MGYNLHHFWFPDLADSALAWLHLLLADSLGVHRSCFRVSLPSCLDLLMYCCFLEFEECPAIIHRMAWYSLIVDECVVHMAWPIEHVIWWLVVFPWSSWLKLPIAARVFSAIVAISCVLAIVSLVVVLFVSYGYLTMGAVIIIVAGSLPPIAISVPCLLWVTASFCSYNHLRRPRICLLCLLILPLFLAWSVPFLWLDLLIVAQPWKHKLPFRQICRPRSF
jgi:hypothetical protein